MSLSTPTLTQPALRPRPPPVFAAQIINSIRHGAAEVLDQEIMHAHLFRIALSAPFAAGVLEIADQFLLLRIDGYGRLVLGHRRLDRVVDDPELPIAVGVVGALTGLAIGLQAELLPLQEVAENPADRPRCPGFRPFGGQPAQTLARPAQRRHHRRASGIDQRVQVQQSRVFCISACVPRHAGESLGLAEANRPKQSLFDREVVFESVSLRYSNPGRFGRRLWNACYCAIAPFAHQCWNFRFGSNPTVRARSSP